MTPVGLGATVGRTNPAGGPTMDDSSAPRMTGEWADWERRASGPVDAAHTVVVSQLQAGQIEVTELALRLASLDEVFMALTGHAAEEGDR